MKWKQFVKDYLSFTRKERIGLLAFVFIILVVLILPKVINNNASHRYISADTAWIAAIKKLEVKESQNNEQKNHAGSGENDYAYQYDRSVNNSPSSTTLFYFDPNTLDEAGWGKLGLKNKTIHTIQNYLSKGGHFYKAEDLKKIYGFHANDYSRLEPYVKIAGNPAINDKPVEYLKKANEPERFSLRSIDINKADTTAFISLPGIGGKLAARIVNFRDKLGGFYSINQVGETYGLPDSTFQKIKQYLKMDITSVKKMNINTASIDELKGHPYIKYSIANPIVSYRNEHGQFSRLEDIKKVMAVTDEVYDKIAPYLVIQ